MVAPDPHQEVREAIGRAIRRLGVLEYVILGIIILLSLACGALIAFLATSLLEVPFRITWAVASILVFVIPAVLVWSREMRANRDVAPPTPESDPAAPEAGRDHREP